MTAPTNRRADAACRDADPDLFFPVQHDRASAAPDPRGETPARCPVPFTLPARPPVPGCSATPRAGFVVGADRAGHTDVLRAHGANVMVGDLAQWLDAGKGRVAR